MRIGIDCIHYPISKSLDSHRGSWAKYWKFILERNYPDAEVKILHRHQEDEWQTLDKIFIYHGMEFNGALNLAGGLSDEVKDRFYALAKSDPSKFVSIEHEMPDFYNLLLKRKVGILSLENWHKDVLSIQVPDSEQIVLGDSHSLSVMTPMSDAVIPKVYRTDFKTLHGALSIGLDKMVDFTNVKRGTFYFGNIDARHHFLRHGNYEEAVLDLLSKYITQVQEIQEQNGMQVELVQLLPMTKDSRVLPKSGYYDGTPFCGSLEDRIKAIDFFNNALEEIGQAQHWDIFNWPEEYKDSDGTLNENFMEKPRSVHMSQRAYRYQF